MLYEVISSQGRNLFSVGEKGVNRSHVVVVVPSGSYLEDGGENGGESIFIYRKQRRENENKGLRFVSMFAFLSYRNKSGRLKTLT